MAGNVWEWTRSSYTAYPYDKDDGREDLTSDSEAPRVLRGGSFGFNQSYARCAVRNNHFPWFADTNFGFRVCAPIYSEL